MMHFNLAILLILTMLHLGVRAETSANFKLAVIADCQYADQANKGNRFYTSCPKKLAAAVKTFNTLPLEGVIHLGDFIDKDFSSYDKLLNITQTLQSSIYHVVGNHDFSVENEYKQQIPQTLNLPARYYSFEIQGWLFIALDGNDVSVYAWPEESQKHKQNMALYQTKYSNRKKWNGAIGDEQLTWLHKQLQSAEDNKQKVILMSHFPVFPDDMHNLWNASELLNLIDNYPSVKAWFNGHNHVGNYGKRNGVHYITFHAMLDTAETAYSIVEFDHKQIKINGTGKQPSMTLAIN